MDTSSLRPSEVIKAYWLQVIFVEETATWLDPVYLEARHE